MKFTFKTDKPKGAYSSFFKPIHYIKYKKQKVGNIIQKDLSGGSFKPGLQVIKADIMEDGNPNCKWKWVWFLPQPTLQAAKDLLNNNIDSILEKYVLKTSD